MSMSDEELAQLESEYARMFTEHMLLSEQMVAVARKIAAEKEMRGVRPEPQPGDFRPRPSTPLQPPRDPGDEGTEDSSSL